MLKDRQQQVIQLVQVATGIVETWQARERSGEVSREAAQKAALDQLRVIRFGAARDYFFMQRYSTVPFAIGSANPCGRLAVSRH